MRSIVFVAVVLLVGQAFQPDLAAQPTPADLPSHDGLKLGKVPAVVYSQLPDLPPDKGILVVDVAPGSPADKAGLKQHDILLYLDGKALTEPEQLAMYGTRTAEVALVLFRSGREKTVRIPAVVLARLPRLSVPKAMLKPGGPPTVTLEAKPLKGNRLSVTFTYFADGSSKLESVNCSGSLDEIKKSLKDQKRMSPQLQDLAEVALERLRVINSSSKPEHSR
jgi:PDZ domain